MIDRLPKNWCIRQDAHQDVCDWFNAKYGISSFLEGGYTYLCKVPLKDTGSIFQEIAPIGFLEITYEEFKFFILDKEHLKKRVKSKPEDLSYLIDFLKQQQIN